LAESVNKQQMNTVVTCTATIIAGREFVTQQDCVSIEGAQACMCI